MSNLVRKLSVYNTISKKKELFYPIHPPFVGLYVCGPTVYNEVHLGNCRTFVVFDLVYRYLKYLGYKVRYVRNITDVGHLTSDHDQGEDKILKRAHLESLEPMELVQKYSNNFHQVMRSLNNIEPNIEPSAIGHIPEQIKMIELLLKKGYAYISQGSVYFNLHKYSKAFSYGDLSGKKIEDLQMGSRVLEGSKEKLFPEDFALWKKAYSNRMMKWDSPWGVGFPGWHLECSVMSMKYLGHKIDIHGGGMDLKFPHHECEIAQSRIATQTSPVNYWVHTNMLTIDGEQMSKSKGNGITPMELFLGNGIIKEKFHPMTLRMLFLQTHYRSTIDISLHALQSAQKAYIKLINGLKIARSLEYPTQTTTYNKTITDDLIKNLNRVEEALCDDFNSAKAIGYLFELTNKFYQIIQKQLSITDIEKEQFYEIKKKYIAIITEILGLEETNSHAMNHILTSILEMYQNAKNVKNYKEVDKWRAYLRDIGIEIRDTEKKSYWMYKP